MWLYIETTRPDSFTVGLLGDGAPKYLALTQDRSHAVVVKIMKLLTPTVRRRMKGICVVSGPGSFTSTRTGVILANILSRQLRLPLFGVDLTDAQNLDELTARLMSHDIPEMAYVAPVYSSEPNITVPPHAHT